MIGFAHRGGMADAPENSLEAFRRALAAGATGLESDVWLDPQGRAVLHHGPPHKQPRPPLPLAELLSECGTDFDLSLDLNGPGTAQQTVAVCRAAGFDLRRLWLVGGLGTCAALRDLDPDLRLVTNMGWTDALWRREPALQAIVSAGIDALNLRHGRWTKGMVAEAHAHGLLAFAWDVNNRVSLALAVRRGVDAIYSDHVRLLWLAARAAPDS